VKKLLALTFDDGPSLDIMPQLLDLLAQYDARATFFLWGEKIGEETIPLLRQAVAQGHELGNHSMHHLHMSRLSPEEIRQETEPLQQLLQALFGTAPAVFRPPFLDVSEEMKSRIPLPFIMGADIRDWTFETDADQRLQAAKAAAKDGAILLMHCFETNRPTVEMLENLLPWLEDRGFQCVTVSELFARKDVSPQSGVLYSQV
jgi:peptidoglycan/xylan/chitin deacetylase (PgdA/CDA1 family)